MLKIKKLKISSWKMWVENTRLKNASWKCDSKIVSQNGELKMQVENASWKCELKMQVENASWKCEIKFC